jgi:hypothetical protein
MEYNYQEIADSVKKDILLPSHKNQWLKRFSTYIEGIKYTDGLFSSQQSIVEYVKQNLAPLGIALYTNFSYMGSKELKYDLRYDGLVIARMCIKDGIPYLTVSDKDHNNIQNFGVGRVFSNVPMDNDEVAKFLDGITHSAKLTKKNQERSLEQTLLAEFGKLQGADKGIRNIMTVMRAGAYFQMQTAVGASTEKIKFAEHKKGGIDILTRVFHGRKKSKFCVMELKDKYEKNEPPEKAMKQAVAYATFLACLLQSPRGKDWNALFKPRGIVSKESANMNKTIFVSTIMPHSKKLQDVDFESQPVVLVDDFKLKLYSLYFNRKGSNFEFSGSLKNILEV